MQQQTMQLGAQPFPSSPQPSHLGPGATRLPWLFIVGGGAISVFAFFILFFVCMVNALPAHFSMFFGTLVFYQIFTYLCLMLAIGGCVLSGLGYVQLKTYYGIKGNILATERLKKLSIFSFAIAGLLFIITLFLIPLTLTGPYTYRFSFYDWAWVIYLFFITCGATAFGLVHMLLKREWEGLIQAMNWHDSFNKFLKLGYTLAFWSIAATSALGLTFVFILKALSYRDFEDTVTIINVLGILAFWPALAGGAMWVFAQAKLMLVYGGVITPRQPEPLPIQQPQQPQPAPRQHSQQPYQPQQIQQQAQPQQTQQPQDFNERLRQQQYEDYRRQQQERMRQQGDTPHETMPYNK